MGRGWDWDTGNALFYLFLKKKKKGVRIFLLKNWLYLWRGIIKGWWRGHLHLVPSSVLTLHSCSATFWGVVSLPVKSALFTDMITLRTASLERAGSEVDVVYPLVQVVLHFLASHSLKVVSLVRIVGIGQDFSVPPPFQKSEDTAIQSIEWVGIVGYILFLFTSCVLSLGSLEKAEKTWKQLFNLMPPELALW